MISSDILKQYFEYDPLTGEWLRLKVDSDEPEHQHLVGLWTNHIVGPNKYRALRVSGKTYLAHRLAYLYMTGSWPPDDIDHINQERNDNRWCNLRPVTRAENLTNKPKYRNNTTGSPGITRVVSKHTGVVSWRAVIYLAGKQINLGTHKSFEDARAARKAAESKYFLPKQ